MATHLLSQSATKVFSKAALTKKPRQNALRQFVVRASDSGSVINQNIKKEEAKVVDMLSCKDIKGKAVMCRCWKSAKFPYCDGKHVEHNKATGDNVGPLIISEE